MPLKKYCTYDSAVAGTSGQQRHLFCSDPDAEDTERVRARQQSLVFDPGI